MRRRRYSDPRQLEFDFTQESRRLRELELQEDWKGLLERIDPELAQRVYAHPLIGGAAPE